MKYLTKSILASLCIGSAFSASAEVEISNAWVRLLPPVVKTTAAYFDMRSDVPDKLISVSSPISERVEMHNSSMEDGMMSMDHITQIDLLENNTVSLSPLGMHLMVVNLKQVLNAGEKYPFTLTFKESGELTVLIPVESR